MTNDEIKKKCEAFLYVSKKSSELIDMQTIMEDLYREAMSSAWQEALEYVETMHSRDKTRAESSLAIYRRLEEYFRAQSETNALIVTR